jgi:polysaccharide pyruvyl transferase WcaK-like protein
MSGLSDSVLILPPADHGSIGDEAMLTAIFQDCIKDEVKHVTLLRYGYGPSWLEAKFITRYKNNFKLSEVVLSDLSKLRLIATILSHKMVIVMGADMMDGYYNLEPAIMRWKLARFSQLLLKRTFISGFSFNREPSLEIVKEIAKKSNSTKVCVRDRYSYERLIKYTRASLVADLAFKMEPIKTKNTDNIDRKVSKLREKSSILVGVNLNFLVFKSLLDNGKISEEELFDKIANQMNILAEKNNISYILVPHDYRSKEQGGGDATFLRSIQSRLNCSSYLISEELEAAEIKQIVQYFDFTITGRMHFAIACLGMGVVPLSMTYQDKFKGVYAHFELVGSDFCVSPTQVLDGKLLIEKVNLFLKTKEKNVNQVYSRLPVVTQLSRNHFL